MRSSIRILLATLTMALSCCCYTMAKTSEPDFRYPTTVTRNARKALLDASLQNVALDADMTRNRALLEIITATRMIDRDSVATLIGTIDSVTAVESVPSMRAIALTVKATALYDIYRDNRYRYDRFEMPAGESPADPRLWDGKMFRDSIRLTLDSAMHMAATTDGDLPLSKLRSIITSDHLSRTYFPDLADFIALKAYKLLSGSGMSREADELAEKMAATSRKGSAPWAYWTAETLDGDALLEAYRSEAGSPEAPYLLLRWLQTTPQCEDNKVMMADLIKESLRSHPSYRDNASLTNILRSLEQKRVTVEFNSLVCPGMPVTLTVTSFSTPASRINIYRIPDNCTEFRRADMSRYRLTASIAVSDTVSMTGSEKAVTHIFAEPGRYAIVPVIDGKAKSDDNIRFLLCTPIIPTAAMATDGKVAVTVVDSRSGSPMAGVRVKAANGKGGAVVLGVTDSLGMTSFAAPKGNSSLIFRHNGRDYDFANRIRIYNGIYQEDRTDRSTRANVVFDRPLYHHGDSLSWSLVAYSFNNDGTERRTADGINLTARLLDANSRTVDSVGVTTDGLGRACRSIRLPSDGVSGYYSLMVYDSDKRMIGAAGVTVSDFKLPTFSIDSLHVSRPAGRDGVDVTGLATTYSGMPVTGAAVTVDFFTSSRWWRTREQKTGTVTATTDSDGRFAVFVPDSVYTLGQRGDYLASVTVTDVAGSSATASTSFVKGKPYAIRVNGQQTAVDTDLPMRVPVEAVDASGRRADLTLRWGLTADGSDGATAASGTVETRKGATIDLSGIPAGTYRMTFEPVDTALADGCTIDALTIYSIRRNAVPSGRPVFVPVTAIDTDAPGHASITVGCPSDSTFVYIMNADSRSASEPVLHVMRRGFNTVPVTLNDGADRGFVYIWSTREAQSDMTTVDLTRPDTTAIEIHAESFRDRLTAGTTETWRFTVSTAGGKPAAQAGMTATMFNASLLALQPYNMLGRFEVNVPYFGVSFRTPDMYRVMSLTSLPVRTLRTARGLIMPCFFTDMRSGAMVEQFDGVVMDKMYGARAPMMNAAVEMKVRSSKMSVTAGAAEVTEDAMDEEVAVEAGGSDDAGAADNEAVYRPSEVLQAFWAPSLTTDSLGRVALTFTVPDANTTWAFRASAWTRMLAQSNLSFDVVSNKPVMVTPSLPRFMRQGDKAVIMATVFNNTDRSARITAVAEVFDPASSRTLRTERRTLDLDPMASGTVDIAIEAAMTDASIGYRVRAVSGNFSDGEQALIPVIASSMTITNIEPFYLPAGSGEYSLTVPEGRYASTTLEYTANPVWEVVKALPALATGETTTSTGAARAYFGAMVTDGLARRYPALAEVIKGWRENSADSSLVSRLSQNEELKSLTLNETPWVQAAQSQTERMARMALLFDTKAVGSTARAAAERMSALQGADGGIRWSEGSGQTSQWATEQVLLTLARLNALGYAGNDTRTEATARRAMAYLCNKEASRRHPDWSTVAYIHAMMPGLDMPQKAVDGVARHLQGLIASWSGQGVAMKARTAYILSRVGYASTARQVMKSVSEFAVATPNRGTYFPEAGGIGNYVDILLAYAATGNNTELVDGIRRYLIIRAQATEQLNAADATALIAAMLGDDMRWLTTDMPEITIGGKRVVPDRQQQATGHIVASLGNAAGRHLTIDRTKPSGPSYGAVISVRRADMDSISPMAIDDISVSKTITAGGVGRLKRGDKARVVITLTVKRDMSYVTLTDERAAGLAPLAQMPGYVSSGGLWFYRDVRDASSRMFIAYLPKGVYHIEYDATAQMAGSFASGCATAVSELDPSLTARSGSRRLVIEP